MLSKTYNEMLRSISMIKNRTAQLIFQTIYCTLGLVGLVAFVAVGYLFFGLDKLGKKKVQKV